MVAGVAAGVWVFSLYWALPNVGMRARTLTLAYFFGTLVVAVGIGVFVGRRALGGGGDIWPFGLGAGMFAGLLAVTFVLSALFPPQHTHTTVARLVGIGLAGAWFGGAFGCTKPRSRTD